MIGHLRPAAIWSFYSIFITFHLNLPFLSFRWIWNWWDITSSDKFSTKYLHKFRMMKSALKVCHVNMLLKSLLICYYHFSETKIKFLSFDFITFRLTYSSHCADAFNSAALVKNTLINAEKFPVRQLFMTKFLQMMAVDSSKIRWSALNKKFKTQMLCNLYLALCSEGPR